MSDRRLWIDTTGKPVITTTPNGAKNARRWGWTEAQAVPIDDADHEKAVRERIAQDILADRTGAPWEAERHEDGVGHWLDSRDATKAARIAREGA
jgi:hypothetical protein